VVGAFLGRFDGRISGTHRRRPKVLLNVAIQCFAVLWILMVVNGWMFFHSWRVDLTADQRLTIPQETRSLVRDKLDRRIDVVIPFRFEKTADGLIRQKVFMRTIRVLEELAQLNPVNFRMAERVQVSRDLEEWSRIRSKYGIEQINKVYFVTDSKTEALGIEDLAVLRPFNEDDPASTAGLFEEKIVESVTSTLQRLLSDERKKIYLTQGSGELPANHDVLVRFLSTLQDKGFEVATLDLPRAQSIPDDADLVISVALSSGPELRSFDGLVQAELRHYLSEGGRYLLFAAPSGQTLGVAGILRDYGVKILPGLVANVGPSPGRASGPTSYLYLSRTNPAHPVTEDFKTGNFQAEFPASRALELEDPATVLVLSGDQCWIEAERELRRDVGEPSGAFPVAAAAERVGDDGVASRLVVIGSAFAPIHSPMRETFQSGTRQLLLNSIYWLTDQHLMTSAAVREQYQSRVRLDENRKRAFFWTVVVAMPGAAVVMGLAAFWLRRPR